MKRTILLCTMVLMLMTATAQDLKLWYSRPAQTWTDALPVGNSRMGAMVFGGVETEELQLNEETFWAGGPHNNLNPKLAYEPLFFSLFLLLDKGCLSKLQADPTCSSRSNNLQMSMWNCIFLLILDYTNHSNCN